MDDAGAGGVSFRCSNGYDLDAGADIHYTSVTIPPHIAFPIALIFHCNFALRSDSVWGPFVSCPQETVMCGFQTKGYTAFPDNNEIFRVRSVLVMILMLEYRFNVNEQVLVLQPTSGPHSGPHCDLLADPRPPPILPQM